MSVETCDEVVAQENDHLKLKVKRIKLVVSKMEKYVKV
jgi:hypothetical protein